MKIKKIREIKEKISKKKAKIAGVAIGATSMMGTVFAQTGIDLSGVTELISEMMPVLIALAVYKAILKLLEKFGKM